jgi:HD domain
VFSSRQAVDESERGQASPAGERQPVSSRGTAPPFRQWAQVATATVLVAVCPIAIVWWLRASGTISSAVIAVVIGMALSLGASHLGCAIWEKRPGSGDLLFSELMIWGFLRRWRTQRRMACALDMLGPMSAPRRRALEGMSTKEQARLLEHLVAGTETRDPYLHGHSRRVARHSWMIAKRMGLTRAEVARIRTAAAIHDVGKVETPKAILHKAGPLSDEEYEVIKRHPQDGARMAAVLRDPDLTRMIRHHHERLDGTGYPSRLSSEEIPLGARIIAVADTFDAITSSRPYRAASPHKKAIDILRAEAGSRLDSAVVAAFCEHYAGRRPLALWSFLAGLPERVVSWLSGSAAGVASAAKVIAVAALVGGVAATASTLSPPVAKHRPASSLGRSTAELQKDGAEPSDRGTSLPGGVSTPRGGHGGAAQSAISLASADTGSPPRAPASSGGGPEETSPAQSGTGAGQGKGTNSGDTSAAKTEERQNAVAGEEARSSGGEAASKTKGEAPSVKIDETAAKGKSEEVPTKAKGEEGLGKVTETVKEVPGKVEEVVGKTKEVVGKTKEVVGKTKELVGTAKEVLPLK